MQTNENKFISCFVFSDNIVWIFHNFKYISKMTKCYGYELEERQWNWIRLYYEFIVISS